MEDNSGQEQCEILNKMKMHVGALHRLVKDHDQQNKRELGNRVCKNTKSRHSASLSLISRHIGIIHRIINEEKPNFQLNRSSLGQQNMANQEEDISVVTSTPCHKALNNSVVLRTIMNHLNVQDLLRCRLVAKKWEEEATIQILSNQQKRKLTKDNLLEVGFFWDEEQLKFENKVGNLEDFTESCYGNPLRKFPCSQFFFCGIETVDDIKSVPADLFNFLSKCGQHITSLDLQSKSNSASLLEIFRKIIFELTPHIKFLTLGFPFIKENEDEPPTQDIQHQSESNNELPFSLSTLCLKHLQELCLIDDEQDPLVRGSRVPESRKQFVNNILSLAPNLKRISDWKMLFMNEIISSGKASAVTGVYCNTDSVRAPLFVELSRARPQMSRIVVDLENFIGGEEVQIGQFFSSLQLVLESSSSTLKHLTLCNRLHFELNKLESRNIKIQDLQLNIPVMANLESLKICWENFTGGAGWILPIGFSFQVLFPKLKALSFSRMYNVEENNEADSTDNPFDNPFNSSTAVKQLYIKPLFDPDWIPQARALYPIVRTLHLKIEANWTEIPKVCINIWNSWNESSLEELKITVNCFRPYAELEENFAESMDQAFTGFDIETCRMFRKRNGSKSRQGDNRFKRGYSILDMNKLKLLKIDDKASGGCPLFSRVSVIHAFDPMRKRQNLQVLFNGVDLEDMIQERNVDFSGPSK